MRYLSLYLVERDLSGVHLLLEVKAGRKLSHLLHVPTLTRFDVPLREIERQMRCGIAAERPVRRGAITQITERMRQWKDHGRRYPAAFCKEALHCLRAQARAS
jgi:hypothetical protein